MTNIVEKGFEWDIADWYRLVPNRWPPLFNLVATGWANIMQLGKCVCHKQKHAVGKYGWANHAVGQKNIFVSTMQLCNMQIGSTMQLGTFVEQHHAVGQNHAFG